MILGDSTNILTEFDWVLSKKSRSIRGIHGNPILNRFCLTWQATPLTPDAMMLHERCVVFRRAWKPKVVWMLNCLPVLVTTSIQFSIVSNFHRCSLTIFVGIISIGVLLHRP